MRTAAAERLALIREALDELEEEQRLDGHVDQPQSERETRVMRRFRG